ncbi:DNA replication and checkpoint protein-domain-containing protein [Massariosphaeria phaeospora]|uniref:DNA replication regulator SLD2 n=1 Tax=Massariosphaeria phaeospora TaxID=100035 RepID=A0A7C8IF64_9PLEO|nr:DNA replication and checkpoint protein-domain-containing protein [Massariosphaeria phaeospora]
MDNTEMEQRCNSLRLDLKAWEKKFALQHNGRKAGRDDIKANATISQKYKEYSKLRESLSGKAAPQTPSKRASRRDTQHVGDRTPQAPPKFLAITLTPSKRKREEDVSVVDEIGPVELLSPQGPTVIGPTPQRNGIVLGLFDFLPAETPSKRRPILGIVEANVLRTPSKSTGKAQSEASQESRTRGDKTPQSAGKRFLLDKFVTPKKRKVEEEGTPTSMFKGLSTPAFLRRNNVLDIIDEDDEATLRPAPWKRRGLGRSLSSMIQSMKKVEEDRLDEEADIMRELEMEAEGIPVPKKRNVPEVLVEDSQAPMPLGPDRGSESDDDEETKETGDVNGRPTKIWKKRGQKRQTRRTNMRPHFSKPKPQPTQTYDDNPEEQDAVAETQANQDTAASDHDLSDDDSESASDASHTPKKRKVHHKKPEDPSALPAKDKASNVGPVKAAARKVKATAHANYRRLKIKGNGGNGGKGRMAYYLPYRTFEGAWSAPQPYVTKQAAPKVHATSRQFRPGTTPPPLPPHPHPRTTTTTRPASTTRTVSAPTALTYTPSSNMADNAVKELQELHKQLHQSLQSRNYQQSTSLLSRAKVALLNLKVLVPAENTPKQHLGLARTTLELGAVISIRLKDPVSFTRYFQQLQPFYSLPEDRLPKEGGNSSKITGLYLLLLLSDGDYAGFHTLLETLEVAAAQTGKGLEEDVFVQYPIRLERALMEGSYDRVWGETKGERVPSEEFGMFTEVLIGTIRKEIASCSEKAYPSIPISDAKSLLFLDSEGSVVKFAQESGWVVKDGRIYFPQQDEELQRQDFLVASDQVIENTLGYARELEMIV